MLTFVFWCQKHFHASADLVKIVPYPPGRSVGGARTRTATMATDFNVSTNMITSITNTHCDLHHYATDHSSIRWLGRRAEGRSPCPSDGNLMLGFQEDLRILSSFRCRHGRMLIPILNSYSSDSILWRMWTVYVCPQMEWMYHDVSLAESH